MERSVGAIGTQTSSGTAIEKEYAGVKISLENCLFPKEVFEEGQETPSQKDGLPKSAEDDLRRIGCEFIQIAGIMLKVPQVAMASAQVLFQRFFFAKSFVKHKMEEIAMACIWLASKVEECPRRVRDVINVFHYLRLQRNKMLVTPMVLDQEYVTLKNNVIKAERRVLKELGFCVHVKHPHKIIVVYLQVLELEKNRELVQTAWNYMNDSLQTTVFVQYPPETIACACIYLAARVLQTPYDELEKKVEACREALQQEKLKAKISQLEEASQSAANSPSSKQTSPVSGSPLSKDRQGNIHRSSTVPSNAESNRVANGTNDKNGVRRSHGSGYKVSRSRSRSNYRGGKYKRNSSISSSSEESSPSRSKNSHSDLPKSYSQQNSNLNSTEKRHQGRKERKQRHLTKHHRRREDRSAHKSRDYHSYRRDSSKKHKRKFSPDSSVKSSHVNGDDRPSNSPIRKHKHRDSHKKKRR